MSVSTPVVFSGSSTGKRNAGGGWLSSSCAMLPNSGKIVYPEGVLNVRVSNSSTTGLNGQSVRCSDDENGRMEEYSFGRVYGNKKDFESNVYDTSIAPLVKEAIAGGSTVAVFGGPSSQNMGNYLLSKETGMQGLISQAASQMLTSVNSLASSDGVKQGAVTFSWFTFDCNNSDSITDILRTSSQTSATSSSTSGNPDLILRELGKGRGMTVPGLWEVEVANGSDVEAVIAHVQRIVKDSDHSRGNIHTVMQLTVSTRTSSKSQHKLNNSGSSLSDPPGMGRLMFLMLSNSNPQVKKVSGGGGGGGGSSGGNIESRMSYLWVDQISSIMEWLGSKRASPPFHKSRLLLFLRDILCGRQIATLNIMLSPTKDEDLTIIKQWLEISKQLSNKNHLQQYAPQQSSSSSSAEVPSTVFIAPSQYYLNSSNLNTNDTSSSSSASSTKTSSKPAVFLTETEQALAESTKISSIEGVRLASELEGSLRDALNSSSSSSRHTTKLQHGHIFPSSPSHDNRSRHESQSQHHHHHSNSENHNNNVHNHHFSETEKALSVALENSQQDVKSLKISLDVSNNRFETCQAAYDALVQQLREEGSMLMKKDQDRYRKALRDLRDYEIYKEVMEAAMMKLQAELENIALENKDLRNQVSIQEGHARKHAKTSLNRAKEIADSKKRIDMLEYQAKEANKLIKKIHKSKDNFDNSFVSVGVGGDKKGSGGSGNNNNNNNSNGNALNESLRSTLEEKEREIEELRRGLTAYESSIKGMESEKTKMQANYTKEISELRVAHTKTLEMLLEYQEENDALRSAVAELAIPPQTPSS